MKERVKKTGISKSCYYMKRVGIISSVSLVFVLALGIPTLSIIEKVSNERIAAIEKKDSELKDLENRIEDIVVKKEK